MKLTRVTTILGTIYGRLKVLSYSHTDKRYQKYYRCVCKCGKQKTVRLAHLKSKSTISCGCIRKIHGHSLNKKSITYSSWDAMKQRCNNKNHKHYKYYGGRGIKVCKRWGNFKNFLQDLGEKPSSKYTIERINNNGNYEPSNCKWATRTEQIQNRRPYASC